MVFSDNSREMLLEMLELRESFANDYHDSKEEWLKWADKIDTCRSELGLPLVERYSDCHYAIPGQRGVMMTYRDWVSQQKED